MVVVVVVVVVVVRRQHPSSTDARGLRLRRSSRLAGPCRVVHCPPCAPLTRRPSPANPLANPQQYAELLHNLVTGTDLRTATQVGNNSRGGKLRRGRGRRAEELDIGHESALLLHQRADAPSDFPCKRRGQGRAKQGRAQPKRVRDMLGHVGEVQTRNSTQCDTDLYTKYRERPRSAQLFPLSPT